MQNFFSVQTLLSAFLVSSLLWLQLPHQLYAQNTTADYTFGDCSLVDQDQLRAEIEQVAHTVLTDQSARINIDAIVMRQWINLHVDAAIDREVQRAIDAVYANEGYWSRLWSGWSADKAEEYAVRIANDAFGSLTFQTTVGDLSNAIAQEIAQEVEANFARAASAAFLCMKAYVGDQYSATLFSAFEDKVSTEVEQVNLETSTDVNVSTLAVHQKALGGVGLIVVTEISRRIALRLSEKIAERIAGKIVGRIIGKAGSTLIPVAGWVIGLGLIVWDLWEGGNGALPQIQDALESEEVKAKIRQEVADSIKDGLPEEVSIVSLEIAVSLVEDWNGFCDNNRVVCTLAKDNRTFQDILDYTPLDQVSKVVTLVNTFVDNLGRAELDEALANGQFEKLQRLPESAFTLLAETKSITTTLAWADLAGERVEKLIELGIYTQKSPTDLTQETLGALLNLEEGATINTVLSLESAEIEELQRFAGANFMRLANRLSAEELRQLANYLANLDTEPPALLAADLASGRQQVAALVSSAGTTSPSMAPTATVAGDNVPAIVPFSLIDLIWQFIYANSIVVASGVIFVALILLGVISGLSRQRRSAIDVETTPTLPASPTTSQPTKRPEQRAKQTTKRRRKPRHIYDIFPDE